MDTSVVDKVGVVVENDLTRKVVHLLLPLLKLRLLVVSNCRQVASLTDDLVHAAGLRHILLFLQKLVLVLEARHFKEGLAVVANNMVTDLDFLGKIRVLHSYEGVVAHDLLLAVDEELLPGLDLGTGLVALDFSKAHPGPLEVDVDAAPFARHFGCLSHHLNQNLVLLVLDLRRIDTTYVHAVF